MLPKEPYKRMLVIAAYIAAGVFAAFVAFKYLLGAFMPFIIAYVIAVVLHPIVDFVCDKTKVPKTIIVIVTILLAIALIFTVCYLAVNRIYKEATALYGTVTDIMEDMRSDPEYADEIIDKINGYIPFFDFSEQLRDIWENLNDYLKNFASDIITNMDGIVLPALNAIINTVPTVIIATVVTIVALYYFVAQYHQINKAVLGIFPKRTAEHMRAIKHQLVSAVFMFVRAYGVLMIITFMEMFIGLTVLDVNYAFLIAVLTAIVDLMPILGTGAIVVPWGIIELILGNYFLGIGILVLYAIITVVRQFLEPRIVGKSVGLHPLLALVSMYVGLQLLGLPGLLGFPIALVIFAKLRKEGFFRFGNREKHEETEIISPKKD